MKTVLNEILESVLRSKLGITTDGQNWFWKNTMGKDLRWAKLPKKTILENIKKKIKNSVKKGDIFEGNVGQELYKLAEKYGDEMTDFSNDVWAMNNKSKYIIDNGDIDAATWQYIIEAKSQLHTEKNIKKLYNQMKKYLPKNSNTSEKYLNPFNKKVVVVYGDMGNQSLSHPLLKELTDGGVIFVDGIDNLKKLYIK